VGGHYTGAAADGRILHYTPNAQEETWYEAAAAAAARSSRRRRQE